MRIRGFAAGLFWTAVGIVFCAGGWQYGIFRGSIPGAGFFPFMAGIVLIPLSLGVSLAALWPQGATAGAAEGREKFFPRADSWKKILLALGALLFFWQALGYLGFLLTTFVFIVFLLRFIEPQKWTTVLATAVLTTGIAYIVFNLLLNVSLPAGLIKI